MGKVRNYCCLLCFCVDLGEMRERRWGKVLEGCSRRAEDL